MEFGTGILERTIDRKKVSIDGRKATFSAVVEEVEFHEGYGHDTRKEMIYTNPAELLRSGAKPSFSMIRFAKIKNVIDGVYAVVEELLAEKGHAMSRTDFLAGLEGLLGGDAKSYITAARQRVTVKDPGLSIPQGFYDWNDALRDVFKEIKILARSPGFFVGSDDAASVQIMREVHSVIGQSKNLKRTYDAIAKVYERMTGSPESTPTLFPSAVLPDQEFFKELSDETQSDIPEGLGKALVQGLKEGRVSFIPVWV